MRLSELFIKTRKEAPADEIAKNAQLLIRAGFIYKVMAGVYAYTPLGLKVIENIKQIVREEMNKLGANELSMTSLQPSEVWKSTGRWDDKIVDIWFKTQLKDGSEVGLAWSHEEAMIEMLKQHISSYKDLPVYIYQFQTKLRNELRAKSGIMRGREFLMKDMYSFCLDSKQHDRFYENTTKAYKRVFDRVGIGQDTYVTYASGGAFTKFSHEFQTICEAGEDTIYLHRAKNIAINEEVLDKESLEKLGIKRDELEEVKSAEVGNIFNFGTDKSQDMNFYITDEKGEKRYIHVGSYGIGISRLMGVLVEKFADDKGMIWPEEVAPAKIYVAAIGRSEKAKQVAEKLYSTLKEKNIETILDDRDARPGEKFGDAELMGIPYRVVVSDKLVEDNQFEIKKRSSDSVDLVNLSELLARVS